MKAGRSMQSGEFTGVNTNEDQYEPPNDFNEENIFEELYPLNFDDGELEMLFDEHQGLTIGDVIEKYLQISRANPFNQNWQTYEDAQGADYDLNVFKPSGNPYTKRDIAKDTLNSYYHDEDTPQQGGRRNKKRKTRKNRKHRKSKKNKRSRKHRKSRR